MRAQVSAMSGGKGKVWPMKLAARVPPAIQEARQWWTGRLRICSGVTRRRARESGSSRIIVE